MSAFNERKKKTSDLEIASKQFLPFKDCWALSLGLEQQPAKLISFNRYFNRHLRLTSPVWHCLLFFILSEKLTGMKSFRILLTVSCGLLSRRWWTYSIDRIMYSVWIHTLQIVAQFYETTADYFSETHSVSETDKNTLEEHRTWTFFKR